MFKRELPGNIIAGNVFASLFARLRGKKRRFCNSDTEARVRLPNQMRFCHGECGFPTWAAGACCWERIPASVRTRCGEAGGAPFALIAPGSVPPLNGSTSPLRRP